MVALFESIYECFLKLGEVPFVFFFLCWPWQEACSFAMTNVRDAVRSWLDPPANELRRTNVIRARPRHAS
jgi:hypothetical protein